MQAQEASTFFFFKLWPWIEANIKRIAIGVSFAAAAAFLVSLYFWEQNQKEIAAGQALTQLIVATLPNVSASEVSDSYLQIANEYPGTLAAQRALFSKKPEASSPLPRARSSAALTPTRRRIGPAPAVGSSKPGIGG